MRRIEKLDRKRERSREAELYRDQNEPAGKRARTLLANCAAEDKEAASNTGNQNNHLINHWIWKRS